MNLTFLLLMLLRSPSVEHVHVAVIELNHVHSANLERDGNGRIICEVKHLADYWDFWRWTPEGLHVHDWVSDKPGHVLSWSNGKPTLHAVGFRLVRIEGDAFVESATLFDVETRDREIFPPQKRKLIEGLRQVTLFRSK